MNEIRALPKLPPETDKHKYIGTDEYVRNTKEKLRRFCGCDKI